MASVRVLDIDAETKDERTAQGELVTQQVDERYRLNPKTRGIEKTPVVFPKQTPLTSVENDTTLAEAHRNLDALGAIAVKEVIE